MATSEIWDLPSLGGQGGFVAVVDSSNVAGWLSGRRECKSERDGKVQALAAQAWEALEILTLHLATPPLATEWIMWVPRESNRAADWLASRALSSRGDAWFWHGWWRRYRHDAMVLLSDAGVRQLDGGA